MERHRLKREIIATAVTNTTINRMGATFLMRMQEDTGRSIAEVAKAYTISRETLDARALWTQIDALDGKVPESVQIDALEVIWRLQRSFVRWLLSRPGQMPGITAAVERYHGPFNDIRVASGVLPDAQRPVYEASVQEWQEKGLTPELAQQLCELRYLEPAFDIIELARTRKLAGGSLQGAFPSWRSAASAVAVRADRRVGGQRPLACGGTWRAARRTGRAPAHAGRSGVVDARRQCRGQGGQLAGTR